MSPSLHRLPIKGMFLFLVAFLPSAYAASCPKSKLPEAERVAFLNAHNALRSQLAKGTFTAQGVRKPAATNMEEMTWDCDIEASAQAFIETCPDDHSHTNGLGENLYWSWSTVPISFGGMGNASSESWASEFQEFGWNGITYYRGGGIGHATQMAWATSNRIGCAMKQCKSSDPEFPHQINVVCQYKAPGNLPGAPAYKEGSTCSQCPSGTRCNKNTGLCSTGAAPAPSVVVPVQPPREAIKPVPVAPKESAVAPSSETFCPKSKLPEAERVAFLSAHNALRSQLAKGTFTAQGVKKPAATNMEEMNWDCDVEASAQAFIETCPDDHSHTNGLGENLYWSWSTVPISFGGMGNASSESWASEFQEFGWNGITYYRGGGIGHATQMAWATSNRIGCAMKQCKSSDPEFPHQINVVCQYKAAGNLPGAPAYKQGSTCSQCPSGTTCNKNTGLCSSGTAPARSVVVPVQPPKEGFKPSPVAPKESAVAPSSETFCPKSKLPEAERVAFLSAHNALRSQLAKGTFTAQGVTKPAATNMEEMTWDCDIEASAQAFIESCPVDHSHTNGLGENLYWAWSTAPISFAGKGEASSESWASEFQEFGWDGISYKGGYIGHATQMAWATSNRIGCAMKQCKSSNPKFPHQINVVCQYKAPGNLPGAPAYKNGTTCSQCPSGTTCNKNTGLCSSGAAPVAPTSPVTQTKKPSVVVPVQPLRQTPKPSVVAPVQPKRTPKPVVPVQLPKQTPKPSAPNPTSSGSTCSKDFPESERTAFINAHNTLRSQIAKGTFTAQGVKKSSAANMEEMKWDCALEKSARAVAQSCSTQFSGTPGVGENLLFFWSSAPTSAYGLGNRSTSSWANNFQKYGWNSNIYTGGWIGAATQMAWATSNKIGCAVAQCKSTNNGFKHQTNIVCHYKAKGNLGGAPVYIEGPTCSQCPSGNTCNKNTGLCAAGSAAPQPAPVKPKFVVASVQNTRYNPYPSGFAPAPPAPRNPSPWSPWSDDKEDYYYEV